MIKNIKKFLRENKHTAGFYKRLYNLRHYKLYRMEKERLKCMHKNGVELVHFIQDTLNGEFFFFDMGTLLGIIREGRLLGHDLDVDIGVIMEGEDTIERIRTIFKDAGCEHVRAFVIDEIGVGEDSFSYKDIRFDVGYYRQKEDKSVMYLTYKNPEVTLPQGTMNVVELSVSRINALDSVEFNGKQVNVPQNSEAYLAERYGANWRIPDKGYIYWKGPSTKPVDLTAKQIIT